MTDIEDYSTSRFLSFARDNSNNNNKTIQREKFTNLKKWIKNKNIETNPRSDSALGYLTEAFSTVKNIDDVDDDDVDYFMDNLNEFFNQIEVSDLENDDLRPYEFQASLSPNLLKLIGKSSSNNNDSKPTDWIAPEESGLGNSSPIIKTKYNVAEAKSDGKPPVDFKREVKAIDISKVPSPYSESKSEFKDGPNDKSNDDREYGDKEHSDTSSEYESEYGGDDDDDFSNLHVSNLSPNLMAALGMDTSNVKISTDWTPPETSGLQNDKLKSLTGYGQENK